MNIVAINNICCKSGRNYILKNITWNVQDGEHWVIFGMNGSGKTTLLSILAGVRKYSSGTIELFGRKYTEDNIIQMRKDIGFVSGSFFEKVFQRESVLQIVLSGIFGTYNVTEELHLSDIIRAKNMLKAFDLIDRANYPFNFLSKGEQEQVLVVRALISNPKLLLLDEPCSGLDVYSRDRLLNTIARIDQETNITMLYVTHYPEEILPCFKKVLLLKYGEVFKKDDREKVFTTSTMEDFLETSVELVVENERYYLSIGAEHGFRAIKPS